MSTSGAPERLTTQMSRWNRSVPAALSQPCSEGAAMAAPIPVSDRARKAAQRAARDSPYDAGAPISLEELEKRHILRTLEHTDWNKSQAATILQIERSTLDRKIKAYQLKREGP